MLQFITKIITAVIIRNWPQNQYLPGQNFKMWQRWLNMACKIFLFICVILIYIIWQNRTRARIICHIFCSYSSIPAVAKQKGGFSMSQSALHGNKEKVLLLNIRRSQHIFCQALTELSCQRLFMTLWASKQGKVRSVCADQTLWVRHRLYRLTCSRELHLWASDSFLTT